MLLEQIDLIQNIIYFSIGCCFGSFINVLIYRLPLDKSIIFPRSQCIKCGYKIHWYENIPIISWILLRGKCRNCKKNISIMYPFIEIICGLLFILNNYSSPSVFKDNDVLTTIIFGWVFITILLTLAILDIKYFWLPNTICSIGILTGILSTIFVQLNYNYSSNFSPVLESLIATLLGYMIFQFISSVGLWIFKKPVMGKGDSKLSALIGSWLGLKGLIITIWLAFNIAGIFVIIGFIFNKIKRNQKIPFGTFIAFSGLSVWHLGNTAFNNLIYVFK